MITAQTLHERRLAAKRTKDDGLAATERLKARLARARDKRVPFHLTRDEFLEICRWKLGEQYARSSGLLEANSAKRVKRVTEQAFAVRDRDPDFELAARIAILRLLPGVGLGVASTILGLCFPKRFAPLDARLWGRRLRRAPGRPRTGRVSPLSRPPAGARERGQGDRRQGPLVRAARGLPRRSRGGRGQRLSPRAAAGPRGRGV
jgi:hypothetical protein